MKRAVMRMIVVWIGCALLAGWFTWAWAQADGAWEDIGGGMVGCTAVAAAEDDTSLILAAAGPSGIYMRDGGTGQWRLVHSSGGAVVNALRIDPQNPRRIFAATSGGLYHSSNGGVAWRRITSGKNIRESVCSDVAILPYGIYVSTEAGIFVSRNGGRSFQRDAGLSGGKARGFAWQAADPGVLYAACDDGVYRAVNAGAWERVKAFHSAQGELPASESDEIITQENPEARMPARAVAVAEGSGVVYILGAGGIEASADKGSTWDPVTSSGLTGGPARALFAAADAGLFALCEKGLFVLRQGLWEQASVGLAGAVAAAMADTGSGEVYLAADNGLYAYRRAAFAAPSMPHAGGEPSVRQVQDAAMRYAESEPEKIAQWRSAAARKAWLPDLTVGVSRDSGDLWHWESGSTTKDSDDLLRKGRASVDWSVSLRWELGDLLWSDAQTAIDTRSRLTVELRNSILDEVTKIYFERARVRSELQAIPAEDARRRYEKELKAQELAASLDALTGGYFSRGK